MMRVINCVATLHNPWLVILAAVVCIGGSWVGLRLFSRSRLRQGRQRIGWAFLAAVAVGASVWCTHFIAMLAYEVAAPLTFEPVLTMISLLVVIGGAVLAFQCANQSNVGMVVLGGVFLGLAISAMHYIGMMAYRVDGFVFWDAGYVAASVAVAIAFAVGALLLSAYSRPVESLVLFVLAVVGLHFTGMTAVSVTPFAADGLASDTAVMAGMAVAVAGVALLIVGTGVASYVIDSDSEERNVAILRKMALHDALTGLPNRVSFGTYIENELRRAALGGKNVAVIGVDIDKFKEINDIRGHDAGDQALKIIASRLASLVRDGEFVARIGGDEFAALKCFSDIRELSDFVSRMERELFRPMEIDDFEIFTGASIGISVYPQDGDTAARLISNADLAMYRAKADVGRAICYYEVEMDEAARVRRNLALDLRQAIERHQLELHYQVQESMADRGSAVGYEVLLRWKHHERGYVTPTEFIPLAEETGTILQIGEWVLREACREAAGWEDSIKIAVNISAVQLSHADLPRMVHEILLETGLPASRLELELTETSIIQDKNRSLHALRQIRALGVTVAIDDFGTGYSSLDTLRSFPFDRIKLDRSFMHELEHNAQSRAIIRAVLSLGRSLDIKVLAEGVETECQFELLKREGCHEVQGYLLGRPGPLSDVFRSEVAAA